LPVPGAPDFVHGLTTWRKQPIVVVDLARRLGLPPSPLDKRSRLVLAQSSPHEEVVGLVARPSVRLLQLPVAHQLSRRHLPLDAALTHGVVELPNETVVLPDLRAVCQP